MIKKSYLLRKISQLFPLQFLFWAVVPLLLFAGTIWYYISHPINYIKETFDFLLTFLMLYSLTFLLPGKLTKRIWLVISSIIIAITAFFKISFYYLFQSKITPSAFYIIFETNKSETYEFLNLYLDFKILSFAIILILSLFFQWKYLFSQKAESNVLAPSSFKNQKFILTAFLLIAGIAGSAYIIKKKLSVYNIYCLSKDAYLSYSEMKGAFNNVLAQRTNENLTNVTSSDEAQTYIIIIGESTTSKNMRLYGYYRNTNPLLEEIKDELLVFNDVIAPHTHTIPSLNKILTMSDYENPEIFDQGSLMQLANAAGFKTYWISNQQPIGIYETMITVLSKACDTQIFLNEENLQYGSPDEVVIPEIAKALEDTDRKKLIFIHLIGTHSAYKFRYPDNFNRFTDTPETRFPSAESRAMINEYDNAVLYNDFVVRSIIDIVKSKDENSFVIYFSDHGDEVYHEMNFVGHNEYYATDAMLEVPFIVWTSKRFKLQFQMSDSLSGYTNRRYMLDDFIHSFSDLSQIKFDGWQAERSIFNPNFKERKRIIRKGEDYDLRKKN